MKSIALLFASITLSIGSQAGTSYGGATLGATDLDLKSKYRIDDIKSAGGFNLGLIGGYVFDSKLVLEGAYSKMRSDFLGFGDDYELGEARLALGYRWAYRESLDIVPSVGVSRWRLSAEDSGFLFDGDTDIDPDQHANGTDAFAQLNMEFTSGVRFHWFISVMVGLYDFGTVTSTGGGVKLQFE
jgi:hypothetical protein